jgi:hypothetical protein
VTLAHTDVLRRWHVCDNLQTTDKRTFPNLARNGTHTLTFPRPQGEQVYDGLVYRAEVSQEESITAETGTKRMLGSYAQLQNQKRSKMRRPNIVNQKPH